MTDEQRKQIKKKAIAGINTLREEIDSLEREIKPIAPDNAIGRLTRMEAINAKSMQEANMRSAKARLARLENTLERIDSDQFGLCCDCEEPIAFKRLLLIPESIRCVQCAEK